MSIAIIVLVLILLFIGITLIIININKIKTKPQLSSISPKVIYKYIPRTFEEEQEDPIPVSDVFETLFSQPSPWIASVRTFDRKKQEKINNYFVNQI